MGRWLVWDRVKDGWFLSYRPLILASSMPGRRERLKLIEGSFPDSYFR